jgi:hypothetical protein
MTTKQKMNNKEMDESYIIIGPSNKNNGKKEYHPPTHTNIHTRSKQNKTI